MLSTVEDSQWIETEGIVRDASVAGGFLLLYIAVLGGRLQAQIPVDLILMDVQMPEMDGFEATAAIRAKERIDGGHLPIIAMTALTMEGDRERCLASGMDGYVLKPIHTKELFAAIENVVAAS